MSALTLAGRGLREAARRPGLSLWLWAVNTAFAAAIALPLGLALDRLLAKAPAGDVLLQRYAFDLAADLRRAAPDLGGMLRLASVAAGIAALLLAPYVAAGTVEVLRTVPSRSGPFRFARGAWLLGGRFLRLGLVAIPVMILAGGLAALPWLAIRHGMKESTAATARDALAWLSLGSAVLAIAAALLALDLARLDLARRDDRRAFRGYLRAIRMVAFHPVRILGLALVTILPLAAAFVLYCAVHARFTATTAGTIAGLVIAQQLISLLRAGTRVALWSGEIELLEHLAPLPLALPPLPPPPPPFPVAAAVQGEEFEPSSPS